MERYFSHKIEQNCRSALHRETKGTGVGCDAQISDLDKLTFALNTTLQREISKVTKLCKIQEEKFKVWKINSNYINSTSFP